jgi:hypothetical protein
MLLSITQTFIGLFLLNISFNSLKKSVIRKWRQGFSITLVIGFIIMVYGLLSMIINIPLIINNILLFISLCAMTTSIFLISKMNGLSA